MTTVFLFLAAFLACAVEAVEATTVVLAVGLTRGWRAALRGTALAVVVLAAVVAALGPALSQIPLGALRLVVGGLLLVFGLGWLRKAVLRAAGVKARRDESALYERQLAEARAAGPAVPSGSNARFTGGDPYAFTLAFKSVLLEGLEVAFIVVTFGTNAHRVTLAAIAAAAAIATVVAVALAVRGPLSRVPENTIKFVVGVMLVSFGTFWGAEGAGARWPGSDAALLVIIPAVAALALGLTAALRSLKHRTHRRGEMTTAVAR